MLPFLSKKSASLLGLDISSTSVKLLELSRSGDRYRVESYGVEPLPPNAVVEKVINDVEGVGEAIGKLVARAKPATKHAAVAVAGSSVITKIIEKDAGMSADDMDQQIDVHSMQFQTGFSPRVHSRSRWTPRGTYHSFPATSAREWAAG